MSTDQGKYNVPRPLQARTLDRRDVTRLAAAGGYVEQSAVVAHTRLVVHGGNRVGHTLSQPNHTTLLPRVSGCRLIATINIRADITSAGSRPLPPSGRLVTSSANPLSPPRVLLRSPVSAQTLRNVCHHVRRSLPDDLLIVGHRSSVVSPSDGHGACSSYPVELSLGNRFHGRRLRRPADHELGLSTLSHRSPGLVAVVLHGPGKYLRRILAPDFSHPAMHGFRLLRGVRTYIHIWAMAHVASEFSLQVPPARSPASFSTFHTAALPALVEGRHLYRSPVLSRQLGVIPIRSRPDASAGPRFAATSVPWRPLSLGGCTPCPSQLANRRRHGFNASFRAWRDSLPCVRPSAGVPG
ncbi:hypothetical protein V8D89_007439, partial [Ganoderma adspersum]